MPHSYSGSFSGNGGVIQVLEDTALGSLLKTPGWLSRLKNLAKIEHREFTSTEKYTQLILIECI